MTGPKSEIPPALEAAIAVHPTPWEEASILKQLYCDRDFTIREITEDVFDGAVCRETIRIRLHKHDLIQPTRVSQLADLNPEDVGLSPALEERPKYLRQERGTNL